jgi:hypothetical protein
MRAQDERRVRFGRTAILLLLWRIGDKRWATLTLIPLAVGIGVRVPYYLADSPPGGTGRATAVGGRTRRRSSCGHTRY